MEKRAFISYSHDSDAHKERVARLATTLRENGVNCVIDQHVPAAGPPEGWALWTERQIEDAEVVLVVCTPLYLKRVQKLERPGRGHGATFEAELIRQLLYESQMKHGRFLPVVFDIEGLASIPLPLRSGAHFLVDTIEGCRTLLRAIFGVSDVAAVPVGAAPNLKSMEAPPLFTIPTAKTEPGGRSGAPGRPSKAVALTTATLVAALLIAVVTHRSGKPDGATAIGATMGGGLPTTRAQPAREPDARPVLEKWLRVLSAAQDRATGGIRATPAPGMPAQAWATSQVLAATMQAKTAGLGTDELNVPKMLSYIERSHHAAKGTVQAGYGMWTKDPFALTEIGAWVVVGKVAAYRASAPSVAPALSRLIHRDVTELLLRQHTSGGWTPVQADPPTPSNVRTYTSIVALWALTETQLTALALPSLDEAIKTSVEWLLSTYRDDLRGWTATPGRRTGRSLALTAMAIFVLGRTETAGCCKYLRDQDHYQQIKRNFLNELELTTRPLALDDALDSIDTIMQGFPHPIEASTFMWLPWSLAASHTLSGDSSLTAAERRHATDLESLLFDRLVRAPDQEAAFIVAERLLCGALSFPRHRGPTSPVSDR